MKKINIVDERNVLGVDFRIYGDFDNPMFLARDIANLIEHNKPSEMILNVDEDEKVKVKICHSDSIEGVLQANTEYWFVTEDGLYEILMQSRKPIAKEFKKEVKNILKDLRKGNTYIAPTQNNDLMIQMMQAVTDVLNRNQIAFQESVQRQLEDSKRIITDQEIRHEQQIADTRKFIHLKSVNVVGLSKILKARITDLKGYNINARDDYHYTIAKERLFKKYGVVKWEDFQIDDFDGIHADIDSIEDLDSIIFI